MNPIHLIAASLLACVGLIAPAQAGETLKIGHAQTVLNVSDGRSATQIDLRWRYPGERIESAKLLSSASKKGFRYLLIDVRGFSKTKFDDHMCGAGTEDAVVWLKLGPHLEHLNSVVVPYNSCWWSIDGSLSEKNTIDAFYSGGNYVPGHYTTEDTSLNPETPPTLYRKDEK